MAKVLLLNGSPQANGCTARASKEMTDVFEKESIETGDVLEVMKK